MRSRALRHVHGERQERQGLMPSWRIPAIGTLLITMSAFSSPALYSAVPADDADDAGSRLRPVAEFASIADRQARSIALFEEAGKVFMSPRCQNCHPATARPTQTDQMRPHLPLVVRGRTGTGPSGGQHCAACHQSDNFAPSGVPGNPKGSLAPASMAWQGKSLGDICNQIKDRERNGGRTLPALIEHVSEDDLVGWAWHPGEGRTPAPGTQKQFGDLVNAWVLTGAICPDPAALRGGSK